MNLSQKAIIIVPLVICSIAGAFALLGHLIGHALGMPSRLNMPLAVRGIGVVALMLGVLFMGWVCRYRRPFNILISTYVSMRKIIKRLPPGQASSRTESLILLGPQRHVRNPLYFAVVMLLFGWWLVLDYTLLLFITILFFLWFDLVVIRLEEMELKALYKEAYENYKKGVPRFFPSLKCRWP
jgi:protein-S-isoprenylcysteine O-methyltransferase Ste14